jgi:hypothetical protein
MFRLIAATLTIALALALTLSGEACAQRYAPTIHLPPPIHSPLPPPMRIEPIDPVGPTMNIPLPPPPEAVIDNPGPPAMCYCVDSYGRGYCSTDCCDQGGRARCN